MRDSFDGVVAFVTAAETGSFAAAALRLNLTRSAIAKAVSRLEARLDVTLFHRTTRSLGLTPQGHVYFERCRLALSEIRSAETAINSGRHEAVGRLRASVPALYGRRHVAPILTALAQQHPKLELEISFSDRTVDLVQDGFDIAIRNGPVVAQDGVMTRRVAYQPIHVFAAPQVLEDYPAGLSVAELPLELCLSYAVAGSVRPWIFPAGGGGTSEILPRSRLRFDDLEAIADAAAAGLGLAWLPRWLVEDKIASGSLLVVPGDLPPLILESRVLWLRSRHLPLNIRLAIDALAAQLPSMI
jgi:DNA-binding transcriptional LysR family regulator